MPENNKWRPVAPGKRSNGTWLGMTSAMNTVRKPLPVPIKQNTAMATAYEGGEWASTESKVKGENGG